MLHTLQPTLADTVENMANMMHIRQKYGDWGRSPQVERAREEAATSARAATEAAREGEERAAEAEAALAATLEEHRVAVRRLQDARDAALQQASPPKPPQDPPTRALAARRAR
eukprot:1175616-Prorocentrum_minimum.AAC.1